MAHYTGEFLLFDFVAPIADFTADVVYGDSPLTVSFTDQSEGYITYRYWDFGDGSYSNSENPTHIYSSAGTYTVSLTVSNIYGYTIETKTDYITVTNSSTATFELLPISLTAESWGIQLTLPEIIVSAGGFWTNFVKMTLPDFRVNGYCERRSNDGVLTLPNISITSSGYCGEVGSGQLEIPQLILDVQTPNYSYGQCTLPSPEVDAYSPLIPQAYGDIVEFAELYVSGTVQESPEATVSILIDNISVSGYSGNYGRLNILDSITINSTALLDIIASCNINILSDIIQTGSVKQSYVLESSIVFPSISVSSQAYIQAIVTGNIRISDIRLSGLTQLCYATGSFIIPINIYGNVVLSQEAHSTIQLLDGIFIRGFVPTSSTFTSTAIVYNLNSNAITTYTLAAKGIGATKNAIYITDGSTLYKLSDTSDVESSFEVGNIDIDIPTIVNKLYIYLSGRLSEGSITITTENDSYTYELTPVRTTGEMRAIIGKGLEGRLKDMKFESTKQFELDRIRIEANRTRRLR